MNKYKLIVTGTDFSGVTFLEKVVELTLEGAVLDKKSPINNHFPYICSMIIETEDRLENSSGVDVIPLWEDWTKEQLESLDWDDLKAVCKTRGITGRDRAQLIKKFLEVVNE